MRRSLRLAWRPGELASSENVQVHVIHRLRTMLAIVDHDTVSLVQLQLLRDLARDEQQVTEQRFVLIARFLRQRQHKSEEGQQGALTR
jgi:hypothetical protein